MSRGRAAAIVFLASVFLFAPWFSVRLAAGAFALVPLLESGYLLSVKRGIVVRRRDSILRGHRGEAISVELILENRSPFPVIGATLRDGAAHRQLVDLAPRERRVLVYSFLPRERGESELGPARLRVAGFFGTAEATVESFEWCRLIVFPRVDRIAYAAQRGVPQGRLRSTRAADEDPTRFRSLRDYVSGDEPRRVNWKASARLGRLATNEYELTIDAPVLLLLNLNLNEYPLKTRYLSSERLIERAASIAIAASVAGQRVGLATAGNLKGASGSVRIDPAPEGSHAVMDSLARVEANAESSALVFAEAIAALPHRARVFYLGPDPKESAAALDAAIRLRGGSLSCIIADAARERECALGAAGLDVRALEGSLGA